MIDLYLGSDIGLWALDQIDVSKVRNILTLDSQIAEVANNRGFNVITQNANDLAFEVASIGLSVHYPRIIKNVLLQKYKKLYNLHPGYLPWGRGFYPVFWALWENTPAGATLHEITLGIDEGPIVRQIQVEYTESDTGFTLFERVRNAEKQIFLEYLPRIIAGDEIFVQIQKKNGSYHTKSEFQQIKRNFNWRSMSSEDLVRLIRCFSFPDYSGFEIELNNQLFSIKLEPINK